MSYGRNPYYIYSDGINMNFDSIRVPEEIINAFLYKILLTNRRSELKERLIAGKNSWLHKWSYDANDGLIDLPQDSREIQLEIEYFKNCEDDIVKKLMGE